MALMFPDDQITMKWKCQMVPWISTTLAYKSTRSNHYSRLTLDEKISQLVNTAAAIARLGILGYEWWSEALHGVAFVANISQGIRFNGTIQSATSFPQVILTASSFDPYLWYRIGQASPITCDPRWGRGQETPGEDPLVTGKYAVSFEGGKLGENLQVSACCKHFTAYDLDNWKGTNQFVFDANDLADTCQPPFRSCIEKGKASGGQWGFNGYITSDCDAVSIIYYEQGYVKEPEDTVAIVPKARMDLDCGEYLKNYYTGSAVEKKKIAKGTDQVVLVMGLDQTQERESRDRADLVLPGHQKLITSVASAANKPVILVLLCGGPVDITFAKNNQNIRSIIWAGYPGEAGGRALAEIIFGDHNPGGRLPMTWYPQNLTKMPMTDMRMRPEPSSGYPGRTYRFYQGPKVFKFDGLSYSNYSYEFLPLTKDKVYLNNQSSDKIGLRYKLVSEVGTELCENSKLPITVGVRKDGEMDGKHAVLLFARQAKAGNGRPIKQLVGFNSVALKAGEKS
ncbi:putative beta-D-xylosidase 7 [Hibiscus syriacus]|uniref:Beta-D-xylosidase 7 n=1 Tax=Hibiscus syriacus TaxID=106335 RepID=A0A6A2XQZ9_HIBSY|nr:putative beta-D-xylosidase 7 [Hibiscus syriacus]